LRLGGGLGEKHGPISEDCSCSKAEIGFEEESTE